MQQEDWSRGEIAGAIRSRRARGARRIKAASRGGVRRGRDLGEDSAFVSDKGVPSNVGWRFLQQLRLELAEIFRRDTLDDPDRKPLPSPPPPRVPISVYYSTRGMIGGSRRIWSSLGPAMQSGPRASQFTLRIAGLRSGNCCPISPRHAPSSVPSYACVYVCCAPYCTQMRKEGDRSAIISPNCSGRLQLRGYNTPPLYVRLLDPSVGERVSRAILR